MCVCVCVFIFTFGDFVVAVCLFVVFFGLSVNAICIVGVCCLSLFCGFIADVASTYTLICFVPEYSFTSCIFDSIVNNSNSPDSSFSFGGHVECVVDGS